jgi:hypothetical protein
MGPDSHIRKTLRRIGRVSVSSSRSHWITESFLNDRAADRAAPGLLRNWGCIDPYNFRPYLQRDEREQLLSLAVGRIVVAKLRGVGQ